MENKTDKLIKDFDRAIELGILNYISTSNEMALAIECSFLYINKENKTLEELIEISISPEMTKHIKQKIKENNRLKEELNLKILFIK